MFLGGKIHFLTFPLPLFLVCANNEDPITSHKIFEVLNKIIPRNSPRTPRNRFHIPRSSKNDKLSFLDSSIPRRMKFSEELPFLPHTLFKSENERQKIEPLPIPLPRGSRNFPDVKTRNNFFFHNWTSEIIPFIYFGMQMDGT